MTWHRLSPAVLTLLIFLLAQGFGTVLLLVTGAVTLPDFSISLSIPLFSLALMAVDIFAVLGCYFFLHGIRFVTAVDIARVKWCPGMFAVAGGVLGAMSISVLTDKVELPDTLAQMSLAMSHDFLGLMAIAVVGPICEELLFREAIEGEMLRRGASPWTAIVVSALAFSLIHLNFAQGAYAFPIGLLFGVIYYKTGNIILSSLLHILNNSIVAAQLFFLGEDVQDLSYAALFGSTAAAYVFMAFTGVLCLVLMKVFWDSYPPLRSDTKNVLS